MKVIGGKTSAASKNKWAAKVYDDVRLQVKKGKKDIIRAHAETRGESINGFINRAIDETMERDKRAQKAPDGLLEDREDA